MALCIQSKCIESNWLFKITSLHWFENNLPHCTPIQINFNFFQLLWNKKFKFYGCNWTKCLFERNVIFLQLQIVFLPLDGRNLTDWGAFSVTLLLRSERETGKVNNLIKGDSPCPTLASYNVPPFVCEIRFNSPMAPVDIHHMFNIHPSFCVKTGRCI